MNGRLIDCGSHLLDQECPVILRKDELRVSRCDVAGDSLPCFKTIHYCEIGTCGRIYRRICDSLTYERCSRWRRILRERNRCRCEQYCDERKTYEIINWLLGQIFLQKESISSLKENNDGRQLFRISPLEALAKSVLLGWRFGQFPASHQKSDLIGG